MNQSSVIAKVSENDQELQLTHLERVNNITPFVEKIKETNLYPLKSKDIKIMQTNVGKVCNMYCKHCHVNAGPHRTESMNLETMAQCLRVLADTDITTLDITGGAPELNPHLPWFIEEANKLRRRVMVRTNLTVLSQPEYTHLMELYARHNVELVSSLPYYRDKDTDKQRGQGVFETSIQILRDLNNLGYSQKQSPLKLNLVYNPGGAFLPPAQHSIEADFRKELRDRHGIVFNNLLTITNVPVGRFLTFLHQSGNLPRYMDKLAGAFNPLAADRVMCRDMISVGWEGQLYDCDFNQMLGLNCQPGHIREFDLAALQQRHIELHNHCYACTAGAGSSCGGATA
ncbi:MAG: radical SAM/Cys-rich domain protein [Firmicutes bacterium]|nr:radical SAM/Cys-rich domain protein [Bacillota bacterium]